MRSGKLSSADWKSPQLGLIAQQKPSVRTRVAARCFCCKAKVRIIFRELIRSANRHIALGLRGYHCPDCLRSTNVFVDMHRRNSIKAKELIVIGSSDRSRLLWTDPNYRRKVEDKIRDLTTSEDFRKKVSEAIRKKFQDNAYKTKIKVARRQYWSDHSYRNSKSWDQARFIAAASQEHGDRYCYDYVDYQNIKSKVTILCRKHGLFLQRPSHHVFYGNGCPKCAVINEISRPQQEICNWLESLGYRTIINDRKRLDVELDIYIPAFDFAIEYHGGFWHSFNSTETTLQRYRHYRKADLASANGIRLFQLFDVEWLNKQSLVKSMILHRLGLSKSIYARSCSVVRLNPQIAKSFFDLNHLAGSKPADVYYGLEHRGDLVSAISFIQKPTKCFEIARFCSIPNTSVVGGLSKLLAAAKFSRLFTYADRRYSTAMGYLAVGFSLISITKPGYYYWRNNRLFNRRKFQKHKLSRLLASFDPKLTEAENMFRNGYRRIWDAGHFRLVKS